jgi:hypothetical protein
MFQTIGAYLDTGFLCIVGIINLFFPQKVQSVFKVGKTDVEKQKAIKLFRIGGFLMVVGGFGRLLIKLL